MKIRFLPHFNLSTSCGFPYLAAQRTGFTESTDIATIAKAVPPLDQTGLSVSVRLSCGRAGGNLKVL